MLISPQGSCVTAWAEAQLSLLGQILRDEIVSSGDFLQITASALPKGTALFAPHITHWQSSPFSFGASKYCVFPTICDQQRGVHFAPHSLCISIVFDYPSPYPSPHRVTSSLI